mgnify:CR=1 FL=1
MVHLPPFIRSDSGAGVGEPVSHAGVGGEESLTGPGALLLSQSGQVVGKTVRVVTGASQKGKGAQVGGGFLLVPKAERLFGFDFSVPAASLERSEVPERYQWDLGSLFSGEAQWVAAKDALKADIPSLAREFGLGGVLLFRRNVESPEQVAELALRGVMIDGEGLAAVAPRVAVFVAWGAAAFAIAVRGFRWR